MLSLKCLWNTQEERGDGKKFHIVMDLRERAENDLYIIGDIVVLVPWGRMGITLEEEEKW